MAVVSCKELFVGRRGSDNIDRKLKHTRVWEVITDDPLDDEMIAGVGDGTIPRNGDEHPNDPNAIMIGISADNSDETPLIWMVICEYDTELPAAQSRESGGYDASGQSQPGGAGSSGGSPGNPLEREDNPLDRAAQWRITGEKNQEVARVCVGGKEPDFFDDITWNWGQNIVNSAGFPFDPPPMKETGRRVITVTKNYPLGDPILNLDTQDDYIEHVNAAPWKGLAAATVKIDMIDVEFATENGVSFGRVTFHMKRDKNDWNLRLLDAGYYEADLELVFELDVPPGSGKSPDEPQLLNGSGFRKAPGDQPVYLVFGVCEDADFDALGL